MFYKCDRNDSVLLLICPCYGEERDRGRARRKSVPDLIKINLKKWLFMAHSPTPLHCSAHQKYSPKPIPALAIQQFPPPSPSLQRPPQLNNTKTTTCHPLLDSPLFLLEVHISLFETLQAMPIKELDEGHYQ